MNLTDVKKFKVPRKYKFIVGRGESSGLGKTSGRGHKGQRSRRGSGLSPWFEGGQTPLIKRLPKKGFSNARFKKRYSIINVGDLNIFSDGDRVDKTALLEAGFFKKIQKDGIKILGDGELHKKLIVIANKFSKSAIEKIKKAGGDAILTKER